MAYGYNLRNSGTRSQLFCLDMELILDNKAYQGKVVDVL